MPELPRSWSSDPLTPLLESGLALGIRQIHPGMHLATVDMQDGEFVLVSTIWVTGRPFISSNIIEGRHIRIPGFVVDHRTREIGSVSAVMMGLIDPPEAFCARWDYTKYPIEQHATIREKHLPHVMGGLAKAQAAVRGLIASSSR